MSLIVISIDRSKLPVHTNEQFEEWVKFQTGDTPHISMENPLSDIDMESRVREISF